MAERADVEQQLPKPPRLGRQVRLYRYQVIGLPILALLPVLALFGVFGLASERTGEEAGQFEVSLRYDTRTRLGKDATIDVEIRNGSNATVAAPVVAITRNYLEGFSDLAFTPDDVKIDASHYLIELEPIPPGASAVVTVEMTPLRYWSRQGELTVTGLGEEEFRFGLRTLVYP